MSALFLLSGRVSAIVYKQRQFIPGLIERSSDKSAFQRITSLMLTPCLAAMLERESPLRTW